MVLLFSFVSVFPLHPLVHCDILGPFIFCVFSVFLPVLLQVFLLVFDLLAFPLFCTCGMPFLVDSPLGQRDELLLTKM